MPLTSSQRSPLLLTAALTASLAVAAWLVFGSDKATPDSLSASATDTVVHDELTEIGLPQVQANPQVQLSSAAQESAPALRVPVSASAGQPSSSIDMAARLVVRVQDGAGNPVEGVGLRWVFQKAATGGFGTQVAEGKSDAMGLIEVQSANRWLDAIFNRDSVDTAEAYLYGRIGLQADWPLQEEQELDQDVLWIDIEPELGQPMAYTMPPFGWLKIHVAPIVDGHGEPLKSVRFEVSSFESVAQSTWGSFPMPTVETDLHFGPVALDSTYLFIPQFRDHKGLLWIANETGPTTQGEVKVVDIIPKEQQPLITLQSRLLDESGKAFGDQRLSFTLDHGGDELSGEAFHTEPDGAWELNMRRPKLPFRVTLAHRPTESTAHFEVVADTETQTLFDLGDLTLQSERPSIKLPKEILIASGRVLDQAGQPLVGAHVQAQVLQVTHSYDYYDLDTPKALVVGIVKTDANGQYEIRAPVRSASPEVTISANHDEVLGFEPLGTTIGATQADFKVKRAATLSMTIAVDGWVHGMIAAPKRLAVYIKSKHTKQRREASTFTGPQAAPFVGLSDGDYELTIELDSRKWPLHTQAFSIENGQALDLGVIDLRGDLRACHLLLTDENGQPIKKERFSIGQPKSKRSISNSRSTSESGAISFLVPTGMDPIQVSSGKRGAILLPDSVPYEPTPGDLPRRTTLVLTK